MVEVPGLGLSLGLQPSPTLHDAVPALDGQLPSLRMVRCFTLVFLATVAKSRSSSSSTLVRPLLLMFERQCLVKQRR